MFRTIFLIGMMVVSSLSFGQNLEDYRWKNRLVIISYPNEKHKLYDAQLSLLSNKIEGLEERKLKVFSFFDEGYRIGFAEELHSYSDKILKPEENFSIQLIGLDGGVKLKKNTILKPEELFAIIDGMPMRRRELKSKRNE